MSQYFKGDSDEIKIANTLAAAGDQLSADKDDFNADAYGCAKLGDMLWQNNLCPLANAIDQDIFRLAFKEIFEAFISGGTFEAYMTVFTKIFGDDVDVTFTVPAPGKLNIDIEATNVELFDMIARSIVSNAYVNDEVVDWTPDNIAFQAFRGFQSQYELEQMLFEMVPAGVFTTISLSVG